MDRRFGTSPARRQSTEMEVALQQVKPLRSAGGLGQPFEMGHVERAHGAGSDGLDRLGRPQPAKHVAHRSGGKAGVVSDRGAGHGHRRRLGSQMPPPKGAPRRLVGTCA